MGEVILHIGHGKTGTSYLQTLCVRNRGLLRKSGIKYPSHSSDVPARAGQITSGNGSLIHDKSWKYSQGSRVLLSDENLFHSLASVDKLQDCVLSRFAKAKVILYTRNVIDFLASAWGQAVKRGGCVQDLNTFLLSFNDSHHQKVLWWLKACKELKIPIQVRNYSSCKSNISQVFFRDVLGFTPKSSDLQDSSKPLVNRSLSFVELEIQRVCNSLIDDSSKYISDELVNRLPEIKADTPSIHDSTYDKIVTEYEPLVRKINSYLSETDYLKIGAQKNQTMNSISELSPAQISIISNGVRQFVSDRVHPVEHDDVECLIHTAFKMRTLDTFSAEEYLRILQLALKLRPWGKVLRSEVIKAEEALRNS